VNVPAKYVAEITPIEVLARVANLQFKGSGIVPSERALVSSYRPSIQIIIIPLSALVCPKF